MDRLPCDYEVKKGMVKDKAGKEIGIFRVCGLSNPILQMTKDYRSITVMSSTDKSPISLSDIENFVASLSFNSNVDFADLNIGFADLGVADRPKATPAAPASNGEVLNAFELAKQHEKSKESVSKYNDKEIMIRGYIKFPPTINNPSDGGLAPLCEKTATIEGQLKSIKCWFGPEEAGAFSALKGEQYITVKGIFSGKYLAELRYCKLVKAE